MTTDHARNMDDELAALRRELAETRREMAHVISSAARQDERLRELHGDLDKTRQGLGAVHSWLSRLANTVGEMYAATIETKTTAETQHQSLAHRLDLLHDALSLTLKDIGQFRGAVDVCVTKLNERATTLGMWVDRLASHIWPKTDALESDLARLFPEGFDVVPGDRLGQKKSDG